MRNIKYLAVFLTFWVSGCGLTIYEKDGYVDYFCQDFIPPDIRGKIIQETVVIDNPLRLVQSEERYADGNRKHCGKGSAACVHATVNNDGTLSEVQYIEIANDIGQGYIAESMRHEQCHVYRMQYLDVLVADEEAHEGWDAKGQAKFLRFD